MIKLTIIIISYNTRDLLKQTLESIPDHDDWRTVVVDNASKDDSVAMVRNEFPKVEIEVNEQNVGFAKANNQVMRRGDSTYYILLNSDTKVRPGAIESLLQYMDTHPKVGAITPKVVLPTGVMDPACHRGFPTPWRSFCYYSGLEKLFPKSRLFGGYHQAYLDLNSVHEIETTAGTAMVVSQKMIDEVGLLDEQFFLYAEDLDWCYRIRQKGWGIVYFPDAVIDHFKSQSGKKHKNKNKKQVSTIYFYDTMWQFYQKHYRHIYPQWVGWLMYVGIKSKKWLALH